MKVIIPRNYLYALLPLAGSKNVRYYLNTVYIDPVPGGVNLVACDGCVVGTLHVKCDSSDLSPITIPRKAVKRFGRVSAAKANKGAGMSITWDKDGKGSLSDVEQSQTFEAESGTYPKYKSIIPPIPNEAPGPDDFDFGILSQFLKTAKALDVPTYSITKWRTERGRPDHVTMAGCKSFFGVVAPMRRQPDLNYIIPSWMGD